MQCIPVAVVNLAAISDADMEEGVEALQTQLDAHFAEAWHISAQLETIGPDEFRPHAWGLVLGTSVQELTDMGYRDLTGHGLPLAKVGLDGRHRWTYPASRMLLQLLANPYGTLAACGAAPPDAPDLVLLEVCAPVWESRNRYMVQVSSGREWPVSDFVYPSWYQPGELPAPFDHLRNTDGPREISRLGGHAVLFDLASGRWKLRTREAGQTRTTEGPLPAGTAVRSGLLQPSRVSLHP
jgi:hypothetical protein